MVNDENQTRQRHDRSYKSGLAKNNNELSGPIRPSAVYDETRQDNDVIGLSRVVYVENETKLL